MTSPPSLDCQGQWICYPPTHTLREDVCVCVRNGVNVAITPSVEIETERRLHLANRTSFHLVKTGAPHSVNGKGQGRNAAKERSQHRG